MTVITYEDKMKYLEDRQKWLIGYIKMIKQLHPNGDKRIDTMQNKLDIIECIMEDVRLLKELIK